MDRRFLMPAASALALCVTNTACTSLEKQLLGEWIGASADDGETFYRLPYTYTETYDGVTYTYTSNLLLLVQEDGRAAFGNYYEYSSSAGASEREEYLYSGDWERIQGREFLLTFDDGSDEIDMNCTLEKGNADLTCDYTVEFESYSSGTVSYDVRLEMVRGAAEE